MDQCFDMEASSTESLLPVSRPTSEVVLQLGVHQGALSTMLNPATKNELVPG